MNQIFVYGESTKSYLVALVFPEEVNVLKWADENKKETDSKLKFEDIIATSEFKTHLQSELTALQKQEKLNGLEAI